MSIATNKLVKTYVRYADELKKKKQNHFHVCLFLYLTLTKWYKPMFHGDGIFVKSFVLCLMDRITTVNCLFESATIIITVKYFNDLQSKSEAGRSTTGTSAVVLSVHSFIHCTG